jgi:hypothetical protein
VKNAWESYGTARRGGKLLAARVESDGVRLKITSFLTSDDNPSGDTLDNGRLFFSVDKRLSVIKKIEVKKSSPIEAARLVRFEMSQSLLEPPENFYFDFLPIDERNGHRRFLSIAYHKAEVDGCADEYANGLRKPSGFKLDALALAAGYLTFCRTEPGDLQALIDIDADYAVLGILYKQKLRAVDCLKTPTGEKITATGAERLATELRMTLSYHLAELFREGITVPPSSIILSGRHGDDETLIKSLSRHFTTTITHPHLNEGFFQPASETIDRYRPEWFLIPLGLTVQ